MLVLVFVPNTKWLKEADVRTATNTRIAIEAVEDNAAVLFVHKEWRVVPSWVGQRMKL